jgi:hypothetical protein
MSRGKILNPLGDPDLPDADTDASLDRLRDAVRGRRKRRIYAEGELPESLPLAPGNIQRRGRDRARIASLEAQIARMQERMARVTAAARAFNAYAVGVLPADDPVEYAARLTELGTDLAITVLAE